MPSIRSFKNFYSLILSLKTLTLSIPALPTFASLIFALSILVLPIPIISLPPLPQLSSFPFKLYKLLRFSSYL